MSPVPACKEAGKAASAKRGREVRRCSRKRSGIQAIRDSNQNPWRTTLKPKGPDKTADKHFHHHNNGIEANEKGSGCISSQLFERRLVDEIIFLPQSASPNVQISELWFQAWNTVIIHMISYLTMHNNWIVSGQCTKPLEHVSNRY